MRGEGGLQSVPSLAAGTSSVVACETNPHQRARLIDALRGRSRVQFVGSFQELLHVLHATTDTVDVVVLPSHDATGSDAIRTIRQIAVERPRIAIVGYCQAGAQYSTDIRALAAAGVHQFVFAGIDDTGVAFRAVLDDARRQCAAECVMEALGAVVPAMLHPMLEVALAKPHSVTSVPSLAAALGVHRKTLFNRCERAVFLSPAELLTWARLALVAHLLETTGCTIETIANELGFASDTALRNTLKRYTGRRASDIRCNGGLACVLSALAERVHNEAPTRDLHLV
jgi:AraC-like DNA-binding protein